MCGGRGTGVKFEIVKWIFTIMIHANDHAEYMEEGVDEKVKKSVTVNQLEKKKLFVGFWRASGIIAMLHAR